MPKVVIEPRSPSTFRDQAVARNLERVAWLMDRVVTIPGTKISVGLDAVLGLLPIGGDVLTGLVQAGLVLVALRHYKVPRTIAARMMANVLLDIAVGSIPILGDLFDVAFKANSRNLKLLEPYGLESTIARGERSRLSGSHMIDLKPRGTPWRYILPIAAVLFVALALVLIGFITVVRWLFGF
jgi:Domain of unknown function (DUF4112)